MEAGKAMEEDLTSTPTESNQDGNVPCDLEKTSELSPGQEDTDRPAIICSSSSTQETEILPSCSKTDSETGETSEGSIRTWRPPRPDIPSNSATSDESSGEMEVLTAETKTSISKGKFKIPPEVIGDARPVITVSEEKDASVDKVVVKNPKKEWTIDASPNTELNYWTFKKNLMSRTVSTTSEDTLPDHGVFVSEESSNSSMDVSHSISNLKLAESVDSGLTIPLVESPPPPPPSKRKCSDPDLFAKKIRTSLEEVSSESTQMTDEELQEKSVDYVCSEAVGTETDKGPLIEFPEDLEGCSKSERGCTKTTMILHEVEDVTDSSSDAKLIKPLD